MVRRSLQDGVRHRCPPPPTRQRSPPRRHNSRREVQENSQDTLTAPASRGNAGLGCALSLRRCLGLARNRCADGRSSTGESPSIKKPPSQKQTGAGKGVNRRHSRLDRIPFSPRPLVLHHGRGFHQVFTPSVPFVSTCTCRVQSTLELIAVVVTKASLQACHLRCVSFCHLLSASGWVVGLLLHLL